MVGIQWPDSVSSQAGPNQGRAARSAGGPKQQVDNALARAPTWPVLPPQPAPFQGEQSPGDAGSVAAREVSTTMPGRGSALSPGQAYPGSVSLYAGGAYPGAAASGAYIPEAMPDTHSDTGVGAPRPGRQAMDAVLRRPDGELTPSGKAASEVSLPRSSAGDDGSRSRARLATVVEMSPGNSPPATLEHVPDGSAASNSKSAASKSAVTVPELLDTERSPQPSTYSDARDSQSRSPMRRSREAGDTSSATHSNMSRRRDKLRLPDFMVHMPAGSGCGTSDLPSSSTFLDVEKGSYVLEPQGVVRGAKERDRRYLEFEAKIKTLRGEHAEEIAKERNERHQLVQMLEDKIRQAQSQAAEEEARAKKERENFGRAAAEAAEATIAQLREELRSEAAAGDGVSRVKQEVAELQTELSTAQQQRDDARKKFMAAKSTATQAEHQRQTLLKQSSTQVSHQLREELNTAQNQNAELVKKLKKMVPSVQRLQEEGERLRTQLSEQTEISATNARQVQTESREMAKAQDIARRQKKSLQGQVGALNTELEEVKVKMKEANEGLTNQQRLRLDENRKQQNAKAEIKRLRAELEQTEASLQQQAQAAYMASAAASHQQMWTVDPRVAASVNPRAAPSQLPRNLAPHGRSLSPQPGAHTASAGSWAPARAAQGGVMAPVGSAVAARGRLVSASSGSAGPSAPVAGVVPRVADWPVEMEAEGTPSTMQLAAEDSPGGIPAYQNGMEHAGFEYGLDSGMEADSPLRRMDGGYTGIIADPTSSEGAPSVGSIPGSPLIGSNGRLPANSASQRLFDVIEKAKERADQRRLLSGAAEEVKVKAQALEELLANDVGL